MMRGPQQSQVNLRFEIPAICAETIERGEADIGVPRVALATLDIPAYAPDALPPELAALPATKPGSRALAGAA